MSNKLASIQSKVADVHFWNTFIVQLQKDFSRAQLQVHFNGNSSLEEVVVELNELLARLYTSDLNALNRLLYLVDVPQEVSQQIAASDNVIVENQLTQVILWRTFQKIQLRLQYKQ